MKISTLVVIMGIGAAIAGFTALDTAKEGFETIGGGQELVAQVDTPRETCRFVDTDGFCLVR